MVGEELLRYYPPSALINIRDYHAKTDVRTAGLRANQNGTMLGQKVTPLQKVGVYVPGGKAAYPSSVLMNIATSES